MNYKNIKVEKRENYAIIEIANNKNNSLDQKTLNEIGDATKGLNKLKEIKNENFDYEVIYENDILNPWKLIIKK